MVLKEIIDARANEIFNRFFRKDISMRDIERIANAAPAVDKFALCDAVLKKIGSRRQRTGRWHQNFIQKLLRRRELWVREKGTKYSFETVRAEMRQREVEAKQFANAITDCLLRGMSVEQAKQKARESVGYLVTRRLTEEAVRKGIRQRDLIARRKKLRRAIR